MAEQNQPTACLTLKITFKGNERELNAKLKAKQVAADILLVQGFHKCYFTPGQDLSDDKRLRVLKERLARHIVKEKI